MKAHPRRVIRQLAAQLRHILFGTGTTAQIVRSEGREYVSIQKVAHNYHQLRYPSRTDRKDTDWKEATARIQEYHPGYRYPNIEVRMDGRD